MKSRMGNEKSGLNKVLASSKVVATIFVVLLHCVFWQ